MSDANLDDLLAALREVSENSDPDSVADEESDYSPDEDDSQGDEDEEIDFRRRKPLGTVMLLQRLQKQAEFKADQDRALVARRLRIKAPPTKLEQKSEKLMQMRRKAEEVEHELKLNQEFEVQSKRLQKANLELHKANRTNKERMEVEADTERMAAWASCYCKEAGNDWREQATAAFQNKEL